MGTISYSIPQSGSPDATEEPKIATALTTLLSWANGNVDAVNLSALLAQAACVNQSGQTVKGVCVNAGPGTRTNVAFGALNDAADQVTGITLPSNGLLRIRFHGLWQYSDNTADVRAAIFIGSNQLQIADTSGPVPQYTAIGASGTVGKNVVLSSSAAGLACNNSPSAGGYTGDVTTGQVIGQRVAAGDDGNGNGSESGACEVFGLPAGTYTVSVQYRASTGTVTVSSRRLYVEAVSFA